MFRYVGMRFDVVKAKWLAQEIEVEIVDAEMVKAWAKTLRCDRPRGWDTEGLEPGRRRIDPLCTVLEGEVLAAWDQIDYELPVIIAMVPKKPTARAVKDADCFPLLIDGNKRLRKAFLEGQGLKAVLLDAGRAKLIQ